MKYSFLLLSFIISISSIAQVDLNNGLVAYYPFNGNTNDESGNGNNAIYFKGVFSDDRYRNSNKSLNINGDADQYVQLPASVFNGDDYTVSTWIKVTNFTFYSRIFDFGSNWNTGGINDYAAAYLFSNEGRIAHELYNLTTGGTTYIDANDFVSTNTWYYLTFTRKGEIINTYINGLKKAEITLPGIGTISNISTNYIGKSNHLQFDENYNGLIDDIRIYNRAINESEIQALYNDCFGMTMPNIGITNNRLSTISVSGFSYQWYLNETSIVGANSNILNNQLQVGIYKVKSSTGNCAAIISDPFYIGTSPPSITVTSMHIVTLSAYKILMIYDDDDGPNNNLSLYSTSPNPNNGIFSIETDGFVIGKIEIINDSGIKICESSSKKVDIRGTPNGFYKMKLFDQEEKNIIKKKILIE